MIATTLHLFKTQALLNPNKIAVSHNNAKLTFHELDRRSSAMARYLLSNGVTKGCIVGIALDRSLELLVSLLAVFKAGAAYVPLDPEYPNQRLEYMLSDSEATVMLTNYKYRNELKTSSSIVILEEVWPKLDNDDTTFPINIIAEDLAYVLYTSGSTGQPKGVMIEHGNLFNLIQSIQKLPGLNSDDKLLSLTTMSFDISVLEFFLLLTVGTTLYLADADFAKDGEAILNFIKKEDISFMQATPSTYKMMLAAGWDTSCNIKLICCGEQLPKDLAHKILSKCARLFNMYGPTETTIYSTGKEILADNSIITIGTPIDNTEIFILNERQQKVEIGEIGEICIAGAGLARGYYNKPILTREKFFSYEELGKPIRVYRTGDLGKILDNGEIQCFGRIDNQIKIRGYRIETGEIEFALTQEENIQEALVVSWAGPNGDLRIAAYVVLNVSLDQGETLNRTANWKKSLRFSLPYYMIPNDFIILDKFPTSESGKINRKELPTPNISNINAQKNDLPGTELEVLIARIWTDNLGIDNIGIHDNFFDLGGHSLTAVKVIVQIKKESGKYLPLVSLFKNPTIAELAVVLENEANNVSFESLVPLKPVGNRPPLYMVHGLGSTVFKFYDLAQHLHPDQPVYGIQARGIESTHQPAESIEEMASQYISEILKSNPDGPYYLSGYSLGGIIAFEMTKLLENMGKKVAVLIMFDTFIVKNTQLNPGLYKSVHKVAARIAKFAYTFGLLLSEPQRTIQHKIFMLKQGYRRLRGQKLQNDNGLDNDFDLLNDLNKVHELAEVNYKINYYPTRLHLFRARKASRYMNDFKYLGWKPYVKVIELHLVDGDHITMFDHNFIPEFAKKLQQVLDDLHT
jgi:amino acid adenylation domain-containing protein